MAAELCGRCYSPYMTRKKRLRDKGKIPFKRTPTMIPSHQVLLPGHDTTLWSHLRFDPLKKCRFCMTQSLLNDYFHRLRTNSSALLHSGPGRWRRRQQSLMCKHKSMSSNPSCPCKNPCLKPRCCGSQRQEDHFSFLAASLIPGSKMEDDKAGRQTFNCDLQMYR